MNKYKRLISISAIFMIGLPIINNIVLVLIYNNINGDYMLSTLTNIIDTTISIMATFVMYVTLGLLINSLLRKNFTGFTSKPIFILYVISLLIIYVSDFIFASDIIGYVIYSMFVVLGDVVILAAALILCKKAVRRYKITQPKQLSFNGKIISMKNPLLRTLLLMTIVIFVYNFTFNTIDIVMLISQYGFPGNFGEVIYLIEPYLSYMIYAAAGYLTMYVISLFWYKFTSTSTE